MYRRLVLVSFCCLSACSSVPEVFLPGTDLPELTGLAQAPVETVGADEMDNGLVCRSRRRSGSRIAESYCYTREEYAAEQQARDEKTRAYVNALDQDQRNREMAQQQREQERRSGVILAR
jgi:hypothetical protein